MNMIPKVSVILPVFAPPSNLQRAIASVLRQTVPELELIVVDATDAGIAATVSLFSATDQRVQYIRCERNQLPNAADAGLRAARAPWVAFQRDGDEWMLDRLSQQLACAEQQGEKCHLVVARLLQYMPVALTRMVYWRASPTGSLDVEEARSDIPSLLQTALIRRSALEAVPAFDVRGSAPQSLDWCRCLIEQGHAATIAGCATVTYVSSGIKKPNPTLDWISQALKR